MVSSLQHPRAGARPRGGRPAEELMRAFDSSWEYARPWPGPVSRARLRSWSDHGKFAVAWLSSRLDFLEGLVGAAQGWTMFTPDVSTGRTMVRSRLHFADGSTRELRCAGEPEDLTRYGPWPRFTPMRLGETPGRGKRLGNQGWCNLLRHRHPGNEAGSPLIRITLYEVHFDFPPPGVDPGEFLREQMRRARPGGEQASAPFFEYEVPDRD
jgi:hypothetical protein